LVKKEREYPLRLKQDEALLRNLRPDHKKRAEIRRNIRKGKAGFRGEEELDYHLSFLPEDQFLIFNDLRLAYQNRHFQLDTLLLSLQASFLIESKNIYGHLFFDSHTKQLIRTFDGQKDGFPDPLLQVERQKTNFQKWLSQFTIKPIPIYVFVSIGQTSTILETQPGNYHIFKKIFHAEHIPNQILLIMKEHPEPRISPYQLKKMSDLLLKEHTPEQPSILSTYPIPLSDLLPGVPCPNCSLRPMKRIHGKWQCEQCNHLSRNAHVQVIEDYLLLHGSINNPQCRSLLGINQIHTVKRMLKSMNVPYTGTDKNRTYYLSMKNLKNPS
jgi:hypothetical protein